MSGVPTEYIGLMRKAVKDGKNEDKRPLKRRKKKSNSKSPTPDIRSKNNEPDTVNSSTDLHRSHISSSCYLGPPETIDLTGEEDPEPVVLSPQTPIKVAIEMDVEQNTPEIAPPTFTTKEIDDYASDDDDDEDMEFEDVDITTVTTKASRMLQEDVVITVDKESMQPEKKVKRKVNTISKEERKFRKDFQRNYIASMLIHGFIRNQWFNNDSIHTILKKLITIKIYDELHPPPTIKVPQMRTRAFLDGLRHLMEKWISYYKVTSNKGLYKHKWGDWRDTDRSPTNFDRFRRCMERGRGTRDIGAQGFVSLLRAADVPSRLVFSLQPPDFTNRQVKGQETETTMKPVPQMTPQQKLLELRKGKTLSPAKSRATRAEIEMTYPVFWVEAWDSTSKTWITIDPIMMKTIENVKYKSKLEPPLSHPHNNLTYVIGYDRRNGVRDITKRYAQKYYSKTRKRRITKEESEEIWYSGFIDALNSRPRNKADQFEDEYFAKRAEQEGMPDSIQDFKGHPFYCLESQLKTNEVIYPVEPCGTLRVKGRNEAIQVHKRSNVQYLRSPRAWYQRGRILKTGMKPMKVRQKTSTQIARNLAFDDDDEDKEERLYAEFQTELYVPPPVTDGLIEKNAYGNIDVFVPSMIPEGSVLIDTPHAEDAAKALGIDYARAVIGFKFDRRQATPNIGGVVVGADFKEAMEVVQEQLKVEAMEKERMALEIRSLKGWNVLLTKLRIKQRLDKSHGKLDEDADLNSEDEFEKMQKEYEDYVANEDEDDELSFGEDANDYEEEEEKQDIMAGGFLAEDAVWDPRAEDDCLQETDGLVTDGGFLEDEDDHNAINSAGVQPRDYQEAAGGFIASEDEDEDDGNAGGFITESHDDKTQGDDDNGDLEDYDAFMNGLEDDYADYDEEGDGMEEVEEDDRQPRDVTEENPIRTSVIDDSDSSQRSQSEEKITETIQPSFEEGITQPRDEVSECPVYEDDVTPTREPITSKRPIQSPHEDIVTASEVKQLSQDAELEIQFNEQLERERLSTTCHNEEVLIDIPDEDDEFEYYSD